MTITILQNNNIMPLDKLFEELELYLWRKRREHDQSHTAESLTFNELDYLVFINANASLRLTDLAYGLNITKASASGMVNKLEQRGFVTRSNNHRDSRVSHITLTPQGELSLVQDTLFYKNLAGIVKKHMSSDDFCQLEILLDKTFKILNQHCHKYSVTP